MLQSTNLFDERYSASLLCLDETIFEWLDRVARRLVWWRVVFGRLGRGLGMLMEIELLDTLMEMGFVIVETISVLVRSLHPRAVLARRFFRSPVCNGAPFHKTLPIIRRKKGHTYVRLCRWVRSIRWWVREMTLCQCRCCCWFSWSCDDDNLYLYFSRPEGGVF